MISFWLVFIFWLFCVPFAGLHPFIYAYDVLNVHSRADVIGKMRTFGETFSFHPTFGLDAENSRFAHLFGPMTVLSCGLKMASLSLNAAALTKSARNTLACGFNSTQCFTTTGNLLAFVEACVLATCLVRFVAGVATRRALPAVSSIQTISGFSAMKLMTYMNTTDLTGAFNMQMQQRKEKLQGKDLKMGKATGQALNLLLRPCWAAIGALALIDKMRALQLPPLQETWSPLDIPEEVIVPLLTFLNQIVSLYAVDRILLGGVMEVLFARGNASLDINENALKNRYEQELYQVIPQELGLFKGVMVLFTLDHATIQKIAIDDQKETTDWHVARSSQGLHGFAKAKREGEELMAALIP